MKTVDIEEAKTHLSELVEEAERGEPFIIAEAGKPKVKVVPLEETKEEVLKRRIGFMKGMYSLPDNFEETDRELDREIEELFVGNEGESDKEAE